MDKGAILAAVDDMKGKLITISDTIHGNPELGHQEYRAAALLTGELEQAGFAITKNFGQLPTAFRAVLKGKDKKPVIGLLAEYDALPVVGHACGHNIIGTAAVGAALALAPFIQARGGTLVVLGTPAEETDGAKATLVQQGLLNDLDAALMIHPGTDTVVAAPSLALDALEFSFRGRSAHAAAAPEEGINALDGVILTFNGINALRQHLPDGVRIHGIINKGGETPNVVPEEAAARFYVRAVSRTILNQVVEKVTNCARGAALATGSTLTSSNFELSFDEIKNNRILGEVMADNLRTLGERVGEATEGFGSLDMGNVSQLVPAVHPYISMGPTHPVPHTREFTVAAGSAAGHRCLLVGAKALAATVYDLFTDPRLLLLAKTELEASRGFPSIQTF